ncbi:MAG: hypothetical protein ACNA8P_05070, partial [Phycisphaerales bacterium]
MQCITVLLEQVDNALYKTLSLGSTEPKTASVLRLRVGQKLLSPVVLAERSKSVPIAWTAAGRRSGPKHPERSVRRGIAVSTHRRTSKEKGIKWGDLAVAVLVAVEGVTVASEGTGRLGRIENPICRRKVRREDTTVATTQMTQKIMIRPAHRDIQKKVNIAEFSGRFTIRVTSRSANQAKMFGHFDRDQIADALILRTVRVIAGWAFGEGVLDKFCICRFHRPRKAARRMYSKEIVRTKIMGILPFTIDDRCDSHAIFQHDKFTRFTFTRTDPIVEIPGHAPNAPGVLIRTSGPIRAARKVDHRHVEQPRNYLLASTVL